MTEAADEITRLNALVDEMREGLGNAVSALESWRVSPIGGCEKLRALITKASRDSGHG